MSEQELKAPFPWFGGKRKVAHIVWARFGDVDNYVEPFFVSGAVLLGRPPANGHRIETINDKDGYVANFWRAIQRDPEQVAYYADHPVVENDLHARHIWLVNQRDTLVSRLEGDPDYYDAKIAGWWCWGVCCWIGHGFGSGDGPWRVVDGQFVRVGGGQGILGSSKGVFRKLVHLSTGGQGILGSSKGVCRKRVHLGGHGQGVARPSVHHGDGGIYAWFESLADRLQHVRVCCGDWTRVCGPAATVYHGTTGVFLDPPYAVDDRSDCYAIEDRDVANAVREWAIRMGDDPRMRIALCGYEGEHDMPDTWECVSWKANGGYGNMNPDNKNAWRERIWFSPHCVRPRETGDGQMVLFQEHL